MSKTITTQLTSESLKLNILIAKTIIVIGILIMVFNADNSHYDYNLVWGSLIMLYGFCHLVVTRVLIRLNHK